MSAIAGNLQRVRERIAGAARRAGRDASEVRLVAVGKMHPAERLIEAVELGVRHFGENRVEEAADKIPTVTSIARDRRAEPVWHMIGHLQSRKAEAAAGLFDWVQSVDSLKLARRLDRFARTRGKTLDVLIEFNVSGEAGKYGMRPERAGSAAEADLLASIGAILALPCLRVQGLMTMAPIVEDAEQARPVFRALRELRDRLAARFPQSDWRQLSMGMTDDFEVAVEEGATMVRVGRAIFGERQ